MCCKYINIYKKYILIYKLHIHTDLGLFENNKIKYCRSCYVAK